MAKLINVCGAGHSGTTMIDLMLGNAPDAFSCGEVYAWFRPYRSHHFRLDCSCQNDPCPYWGKVKSYREQEFHRKAFEEWNVRYIIDSSKNLRWVLHNNRWLKDTTVKVVNLMVWKQPKSLAHSFWKRGWGIRNGLKSFELYYSRFLATGLPFVSMCYDELIKDPSCKLRETCDAIGSLYFDGKERFWEGEHHYLFGSGSVRKQVMRRSSRINSSESFPDEFERAWNSSTTKQDEKIHNIVERLRTYDVRSTTFDAAAQSKLNSRQTYRRVYPLWYYRHWLREIWKRHFPDPIPVQDAKGRS